MTKHQADGERAKVVVVVKVITLSLRVVIQGRKRKSGGPMLSLPLGDCAKITGQLI